ncbi:MAG: glucose-6-phosphate dehydrogenase [Moraxellaceae bacterium]|nr:glucose-6-phosphate dehydrogenase [Moraxellaceae bacterium]
MPDTSNTPDIVIFGGTGDLVMRKLLPSLYRLHVYKLLDPATRIVGTARSKLDRDQYLTTATEAARNFLGKDFKDDVWAEFAQRIDYAPVDAREAHSFSALSQALAVRAAPRVFYLSTAPNLFSDICRNLSDNGMITPGSRVILEKPLGFDLASSQAINDEVGAHFAEDHIFRIDHYLGKEPVQNLMALRFGNSLFEPLWRREWISDVQITVAERIGVGSRGEFYNETGALRDMVQNHILQTLCIVAMEPPASIAPDAVRDEKLKVLRALRPIAASEVPQVTVRGQYKAGVIDGQAVKGYLQEDGIPADSRTETFVAIKAEIDSWRWAGVPFFLRTGKCMQDRVTEIVINFRSVPHSIFAPGALKNYTNRLVIQMQPYETVKLHMMGKEPGDDMNLEPVTLDLDFREAFQRRQLEAYERLLMDSLRGKLTLFVRRDEQEAAWRWVEPILDAWAASPDKPKPYNAGTWGPAASSALVGREGLSWHEES